MNLTKILVVILRSISKNKSYNSSEFTTNYCKLTLRSGFDPNLNSDELIWVWILMETIYDPKTYLGLDPKINHTIRIQIRIRTNYFKIALRSIFEFQSESNYFYKKWV